MAVSDEKERPAHDLGDGAEELDLLQRLSRLTERPQVSLEDVIEGTLDLIPPLLQYPEQTHCRIVLGKLDTGTPSRIESPWKLRSSIEVHGKVEGFIEVSYIEEMPGAYEGPFLKEERYLIDAIAERLGRIAERKEDEVELNKLRMAVQQSADGIAVTDLDGYLEFANSALATMHGYHPPELIGKHIRHLHTSEQYSKDVIPFLDQVLHSGIHQSEMGHVGREGRVFPVLVTSVVLRDEGDQPVGLVWVTHDISERKEAERRLMAANEMWDKSFKTTSVGLFIIDKHFTIIRCNPALASVLDMRPEDVIGRKCCEVVHGLSNSPSECATRAAVQRHQTVREEFFEPHLDKYLEVAADPILDEDGRLLYAVHMLNDITVRKKVEVMLERANAELKGYAHTVAHDLRNPLATVKMASMTLSQVLEDRDETGSAATPGELMEIIDSNIDSAVALINDLLLLAETGQIPAEVIDIDVGEVVSRVLEDRSEEIMEGNASVQVENDLGTIRGSIAHIYQLFSNLIANSIKHSDVSAPVVKVGRLDSRQGEHRYMVRDNGSGIPPGLMDKLFLPFQKGASGGTGIGLSIVQKVVELYGGDIEAHNDNGAVFEFSLKDFSA